MGAIVELCLGVRKTETAEGGWYVLLSQLNQAVKCSLGLLGYDVIT